ncbi:hypothetical protein CPB85DRAFT_1300866, partial [Mucidula mucida]
MAYSRIFGTKQIRALPSLKNSFRNSIDLPSMLQQNSNKIRPSYLPPWPLPSFQPAPAIDELQDITRRKDEHEPL